MDTGCMQVGLQRNLRSMVARNEYSNNFIMKITAIDCKAVFNMIDNWGFYKPSRTQIRDLFA